MRRRRVLLFVLGAAAAVGVVIEGIFAQAILTVVAMIATTSIVTITADLRQSEIDYEAQRASSPPSGRAPP